EGPGPHPEPDVLAVGAGHLGKGAADLLQPDAATVLDRRVHGGSLPEDGPCARQRTIITGTVACRATRSDTDPMRNRRAPCEPVEPIRISSYPSAALRISS